MKETKVVKKYDPITPENAVLLLIDHQVGTLSFGISDIDPVNLRNNTMWLAQTAKDMKLPVILTTSNAAGANGPLFPELIDMLPNVPVICTGLRSSEARIEIISHFRRKLIETISGGWCTLIETERKLFETGTL